MSKCLQLTYDSSLTLTTKFENPTPAPGVFFIKQVPATDSKGENYTINITESGIISFISNKILETSNYVIIKDSNPNKVITTATFIVPANNQTGKFIPGTYVSENGSKVVVDNSNIRKLCVKY